MRSARLDALLDIALSEEGGLDGLDLEMSRQILPRLAGVLSPHELLARIKRSEHATDLMSDLTRCLGTMKDDLKPYIDVLINDHNDLYWSTVDFREFTDVYWVYVVRERIVRGDFKRAWDELKKSANFEPEAIAANPKVLEMLIGELYATMINKELQLELPEPIMRRPEGPGITLLSKAFPGVFPAPDASGFGRTYYSWRTPRTLTLGQRIAVALARYFNQQQKVKRQRRIASKMQRK